MRSLKLPLSYDATAGPVRIVVISDIHIGHKSYSEKALKGFLKENMGHPNTYLLGLGDHMECVVPSDTRRYQLSQVVTSSDDPDAILDYQVSELVNILQPYQDKLIGLAMGNHEMAVIKRFSTNVHRRACNDLNCEDLGYSFLIRLNLTPETDGRPHVTSIVVYGHHGWGGSSRTAGGNVTKFSRALESYWADLYLFGHSHDSFVRYIPRLMVNNAGKVDQRPAVVVNVGTFKRTLSKGVIPTWEESMGFPPRSLGGVVIKIKPSHKKRPMIKVE